MDEPKNVGGRPTLYTEQLAIQICNLIAVGMSIRKISALPDMPHSTTIIEWLSKRSDFSLQYAKAREEQTRMMAEEIMEISDDESKDLIERGDSLIQNNVAVSRAKLRVDTRKWLLSKLQPKKYGERVESEVTSDSKITIVIEGGLPRSA